MQRGELIRQLIRNELAKGADTSIASTELTEIMGIRLMLTNLFRPLATGQKLTPEAFDNMVAEVKKRKRSVAEDRDARPGACMMNTTQWWPQRDHHLSTTLAHIQLRCDLLRAGTDEHLRLPPLHLRADAVAAVLHADLRKRAQAGGALNRKGKYQLLYIGDGAKLARLATEPDVQEGVTAAPNGKHIPLAVVGPGYRSQGLRILYRGPEQTFFDAPLHAYLRTAVFDGDQLRSIYAPPLLFGFLSLLAQAPVRHPQRYPPPQRTEVRTAGSKAPSCLPRREFTRP